MNDETVKIAKSLKRKFVNITPNYICGIDESYSLFSIVYTGGDEFFAGYIGELSNGKEVDERERLEQNIIVNCNGYIRLVTELSNLTPTVELTDIKENEQFQDILSLRATEGAKRLVINNKYIMYMCSAMHPVTKTDKASLKIYDYDSISFVAEIIITKKKYQIHEFIRYRYF